MAEALSTRLGNSQGPIAGSIASTLANHSYQRMRAADEMSALREFLHHSEVDEGMQRRVLTHYSLVWILPPLLTRQAARGLLMRGSDRRGSASKASGQRSCLPACQRICAWS
jgi:hypothetical protein